MDARTQQKYVFNINQYFNIDDYIGSVSQASANMNFAKNLQIPQLNTQKKVAKYQQWAVYGAIGLLSFCALLLLLVCQNEIVEQMFMFFVFCFFQLTYFIYVCN